MVPLTLVYWLNDGHLGTRLFSFCLWNPSTLAELLMIIEWLLHFWARGPCPGMKWEGQEVLSVTVYLEDKGFLGQVSKALLSCMGIEMFIYIVVFRCRR